LGIVQSERNAEQQDATRNVKQTLGLVEKEFEQREALRHESVFDGVRTLNEWIGSRLSAE